MLKTGLWWLEVAQFLGVGRRSKATPVIFPAFSPTAEPGLSCITGFVRAEAAGAPCNAGLITFRKSAFNMTAFLGLHQTVYLMDYVVDLRRKQPGCCGGFVSAGLWYVVSLQLQITKSQLSKSCVVL